MPDAVYSLFISGLIHTTLSLPKSGDQTAYSAMRRMHVCMKGHIDRIHIPIKPPVNIRSNQYDDDAELCPATPFRPFENDYHALELVFPRARTGLRIYSSGSLGAQEKEKRSFASIDETNVVFFAPAISQMQP